MSATASDRARKREVEAEFRDSRNASLEAEYVSLLGKLNRSCCGIVDFRWPGVAYPLYMRCGTSDLPNFLQMFVREEYGFPMSFEPKRILDLGGYVGFASVYLTLRFPNANIVSVEPSTANFQLNCLNTLGYSGIRRINAAVWGHSCFLETAGNVGGDWANRLLEKDDVAQGTQALSVREILDLVGWSCFDFLKCDIEGGEHSVFAESGDDIVRMVDCCAVELHDAIHPGTTALVEGKFLSHDFNAERSGEFHVFTRRNAARQDRESPGPTSVFRPHFGTRDIALKNVADASWAFYMFDVDSCQLHPSGREGPAAEVSTVVELDGHSRYQCDVSVDNPLGLPVDFVANIWNLQTERLTACSRLTVKPNRQQPFVVELGAPCRGRYRLTLQTIMSPGSHTSHQARANWIRPCFS